MQSIPQITTSISAPTKQQISEQRFSGSPASRQPKDSFTSGTQNNKIGILASIIGAIVLFITRGKFIPQLFSSKKAGEAYAKIALNAITGLRSKPLLNLEKFANRVVAGLEKQVASGELIKTRLSRSTLYKAPSGLVEYQVFDGPVVPKITKITKNRAGESVRVVEYSGDSWGVPSPGVKTIRRIVNDQAGNPYITEVEKWFDNGQIRSFSGHHKDGTKFYLKAEDLTPEQLAAAKKVR